MFTRSIAIATFVVTLTFGQAALAGNSEAEDYMEFCEEHSDTNPLGTAGSKTAALTQVLAMGHYAKDILDDMSTDQNYPESVQADAEAMAYLTEEALKAFTVIINTENIFSEVEAGATVRDSYLQNVKQNARRNYDELTLAHKEIHEYTEAVSAADEIEDNEKKQAIKTFCIYWEVVVVALDSVSTSTFE